MREACQLPQLKSMHSRPAKRSERKKTRFPGADRVREFWQFPLTPFFAIHRPGHECQLDLTVSTGCVAVNFRFVHPCRLGNLHP